MKKKITLLMSVAILAVPANLSAQKFLKKVGNAVDKAVAKVDNFLDGNNSQPTQEAEIVAETPAQQAQSTSPVNYNLPYVSRAVRGNVKEIRETNVWNGKQTVNNFRFNEARQLTDMAIVSFNGNVAIAKHFEYNEDGNVVSTSYTRKVTDESILGAPNEIQEISIFEIPYGEGAPGLTASDGGNSETVTLTYNPNGTVASSKTVSGMGWSENFYNSNGKLLRSVNKMYGNDEEYIYDGNDNLISRKSGGKEVPLQGEYDYDDYGEDWGEPVIKKDAKGRIISEEGDSGRTKYTYNDRDYISSIKMSDRWWGDTDFIYSGYEYDSHGNWTKRTMKKTGDYYGKDGLTVSTTREITYY